MVAVFQKCFIDVGNLKNLLVVCTYFRYEILRVLLHNRYFGYDKPVYQNRRPYNRNLCGLQIDNQTPDAVKIRHLRFIEMMGSHYKIAAVVYGGYSININIIPLVR